jgi:AcrR family transcriptional regulator
LLTVSQLRQVLKFPGERARKDEAKAERRRQLLQAARLTFSKRGLNGFKMTEVGQRAGVVSGTVYLYWKTKEELLLSLLELELGEWLDALDARLDGLPERPGARRLTAAFVETLEEHAEVARLLAVLQTVIEHNVRRQAIERFKRWLMQRLGATAQRLEARAAMKAGEGVRALLHLNALVSGLQQMAETAPLVREVLADPELAPLQVAFGRELRLAMETYFAGLERRR